MFRTRVFGGTPDAFHLACEYGPAHMQGQGNSTIPSPVALAPMELDWTSAEPEAQVGAAVCVCGPAVLQCRASFAREGETQLGLAKGGWLQGSNGVAVI
jgi:hypothetical protein